ncbi:N-6 DNA methylase [Rhodopseudomonas sp. P1]|uniref:N-6 DNA methylase n=1 Tax=Rhodopseudomonas sp. P1 TaxID=3434357 RepID=UPI0031FD6D57
MLNALEDRPLKLLSEAAAEKYVAATSLQHRKSHGQFFTPSSVASLMADWVTADQVQNLLDPAFGIGVLAEACIEKNRRAHITAFEKDVGIIGFAPKKLASKVHLKEGDFLREDIPQMFDGFVMNPPYIRHREIVGYDRERLSISSRSGCAIPRSANLYIYFSLKAICSLRAGGRGAILIPSEWMSANFSAEFKRFILSKNLLRHLIVFSHCSAVFDDALTTASVLLIEHPRD